MELFYNQIAGEYISHIYTRGQGYGVQTEPSQSKNATNLLYDAIKFKASLQGSQNQSTSGKRLSTVKLDPLATPQRLQLSGTLENKTFLQGVKPILKVNKAQNSHRSQSTNSTPMKFEEVPRILIQNSQSGNGDYIRLVHLNPLKLANAKMLSHATPLKTRDSEFTNRQSPVFMKDPQQEKEYPLRVMPARSQSVENLRILKENQNVIAKTDVGYKPQVRKRVKAYRTSMLDSLKNQGPMIDRVFDLKDRLPLPQPSLCSVNQEAHTLLSLSNRASSCRKPRKSLLVQRTNNEKQKKRVSICLNHEEAEERKMNPHLINSNRLFRQSSDPKDNEEADINEKDAAQPETAQTNLKMNADADLVSIKLKRRRRSSNPIFDEDIIAELAENYSHHKQNEESGNNQNSARNFILGKKFRQNMIRCLNKMKALKLTPKEVMENENIFSNNPFERPFSEDLIKAVKSNNIKKVKLLLVQKTKYLVYDFDQVHQTALHWAAKKDFADIAQLLLEYGADVDAKDIAGRTPLYMALENDSISALKILLANHANPWSTEDINYKELCRGHDIGVNLLTKARQLTIIMNMTPPSLRHSVWQTKGMAMILGSQFTANEKSMKDMIDIDDLQ